MYRGTLGNLAPMEGVEDQGHTVTDAAVGTLDSLNAATTHVLVSVDTQNLRVTFDGSDPTAAGNGHLWATGYENVLTKALAAAMRFIAVTTGGYLHASELSR